MVDLRIVGAQDGDTAVRPPKRGRPRGPRRSKSERAAAKNAKLILEAEAQIDADLSRAVDAIAFLSRNQIEPAPLIARISPMEAEAVGANLRKAVEWLTRFAEGWHVFVGNGEAEDVPSAAGAEIRRGGLRLIRFGD